MPQNGGVEQLRVAVIGAADAAGRLAAEGVAATEVDTVEAARAARPDAVVLEAGLPDAEAALRRLAREAGLPVVVVADGGGPEELRRALAGGARDYLVRPLAGGELVQAVRTACRRATPAAAPGRVVAVAAAKGGVGRTALAANLAATLGRRGAAVAAVDLDLEFGGLAEALGVRPMTSIADACRLTGPLTADALAELLAAAPAVGVRLLAAPRHPAQAAEVSGPARREPGRDYVGEILAVLAATHAWVVTDLPRDLGDSTLRALDRAAAVLLVSTPEPPALAATGRLLHLLADELGYPRAALHVVCSQSAPRPLLAPRAVAEALGSPPLAWLPFDPTLPEALAAGRPPAARRRRGPYGEAVERLAAALGAAIGAGGALRRRTA